MSKYTFVFSVLNESGERVAERTLTSEQAIDLLIATDSGPVFSAARIAAEMQQTPPAPSNIINKSQSERSKESKARPAEERDPNKDRYHGRDEERNARVLELLKEGKKPRFIADEIGCSQQTIYNLKSQFKKDGLLGDGPAADPEPVVEETQEGGKDSAVVKRLLREGLTDAAIAERIGCMERIVAFIRKRMVARGEIQK
jgi:DNA-binding NarL/FixJ family response regulator